MSSLSASCIADYPIFRLSRPSISWIRSFQNWKSFSKSDFPIPFLIRVIHPPSITTSNLQLLHSPSRIRFIDVKFDLVPFSPAPPLPHGVGLPSSLPRQRTWNILAIMELPCSSWFSRSRTLALLWTKALSFCCGYSLSCFMVHHVWSSCAMWVYHNICK